VPVFHHERLVPLVEHLVELADERTASAIARTSNRGGTRSRICLPSAAESRATSARVGSAGAQGSMNVLPRTSSGAVPSAASARATSGMKW
jgi:hypothetical protein